MGLSAVGWLILLTPAGAPRGRPTLVEVGVAVELLGDEDWVKGTLNDPN
jgi:hypothetical protein